MATIFITGSTTGLGAMAGKQLGLAGHRVIFHARNEERAAVLRQTRPNAIVVGDLSSLAEAFNVAGQVNELGPIDAVIHNAGIYGGPINLTTEGIPATFAVNVLAPYVLTAKIENVRRLVYLSSVVCIRSGRWQQTLCGETGHGAGRRPIPRANFT